MPLLFAYRRWWCAVFFAVLLLPTIGLFTPDLPAPLRTVRAVPPLWWARATERLDPYINDNYGLRGLIMAANASFDRMVQSTGKRPVLIGSDGQLFYTGEGALDQTLGRVFRRGQMEALTRVAARMRDVLGKDGVKLVVLSPPNAQTVLSDHLPDWALSERRTPTEYDFAAETLPEQGVTFVDLRPVMTAALAGGPVYRKTDTHWNSRGALLAFNAAMDAAGLPDLRVDPAQALGPLQKVPTGDLSRFLGESKASGDVDFPPRGAMLPQPGLKPILGVMPPSPPNDPFESYAYDTGHAGPRILVIGDSFTQHFWPGLLASRTSAFAWTHHRNCRFSWSAVERFKPDIVIYVPVERSLPCTGTPAGLAMD
ncbi:alginate O-acetyltransferase AlgX-related protein [Azorhizobium doebereinerae]|uniref:alginate O-acetyltransferase AlgX-related protein n=1 Tax=Azorhizobium doebereinerae TaxID=281091 RepID=UPI0003F534B1|nr:hypothetical protein [Azorhizobium doebereinerae]